MIAIYAEKPDMGTKIAAALFGIPLENGVVVTFSQLEKYERQIKAQRTKNGYFKIRYQGQEAYVTWGYGHMCTLKELPDIDIRYQNWKNIPLPYIPDHYELSIIGVFEISRGTVAASLLSAREILIRMLIVGATHFLICHNHPSGHLQPSKYDVDSTKNIVNAGRTIGIPLVDHLIIGDGRYVSLLEEYGKELFG